MPLPGVKRKVLVLLGLWSPFRAEGIDERTLQIHGADNRLLHRVFQVVVSPRDVARHDAELVDVDNASPHKILRETTGLARQLLEARAQRVEPLGERRWKILQSLKTQIWRLQTGVRVDGNPKHVPAGRHQDLIVIVVRVPEVSDDRSLEHAVEK